MTTSTLRVRAAYPREIATLVDFNLALARETEGRELERERLEAGIAAVFADPARGTYHVALRGEELVGALLVTHEWSDWRNGVFWWIQSVYVSPDARRQGVFKQLYDHVLERARARREVCGLRLYVEHGNERAHAVYEKVGMHPARYRFYEVDFVLPH
jgi:ribosomal protein S18 acetylase RimI-like enzyme